MSLQEWANKLGKPVTDLEKRFTELKAAVAKASAAGTPNDVIEKKARQILYIELKQGLRSPAIGFNGVILAVSEPFDIGQSQRKTAIDAYKANPASAVAQGITDSQGTPLDNRREFSPGRPNPSFGKPLPVENVLCNAFGVAAPAGSQSALRFAMTLSGPHAKAMPSIQRGIPIAFRGNLKNKDSAAQDLIYVINDSTTTRFEPAPADAGVPPLWDVIDKFLAPFKTNLADLESWLELNKKNYGVPVFTEGGVTSVSDTPVGPRGNYRFIIDDESLGFADATGRPNLGVTVWVPQYLSPQFDFAEGSIVEVFGLPTVGPGWDAAAGKPDPNTKQVQINAWGIYARPESKVPRTESKPAAMSGQQVGS